DVVLLYLSGHGVQINGQSFFLPVDVRPRSEEDIELESIPLRGIVNYVTTRAKARVYIFVIDACREVVVKRDGRGAVIISKGLGAISAQPSTFIAYSTAPDKVASDGNVASPFAVALAAAIPKSGRTIHETFREVRQHVWDSTGHKQVTWDESALF